MIDLSKPYLVDEFMDIAGRYPLTEEEYRILKSLDKSSAVIVRGLLERLIDSYTNKIILDDNQLKF